MSSEEFEIEDEEEDIIIEDEPEEEDNEKMEEEGDIDNIDEDEFENEDEEEEEELDKEDGNDDIDVIEIVEEVIKKEEKKNITVPFITKYEYPKILSIRAQQIAEGSPIFLDDKNIKNKSAIDIAELEFKNGKLNNLIIKRKLPNGRVESIRLSELKFYEFY